MQRVKDIGIESERGPGESPGCASFDVLMTRVREVFEAFHDRRTGRNLVYTMLDAALGAFAVFFTQSPSFLSHQSAMQKARGKNNARSLFQMEKIPTDNHIRTLLDAVSPESVFPAFDAVFEAVESTGVLTSLRGVNDSRLIALDGTQTHQSETIHCPKCTVKTHSNGKTSYSHTVLTPVIVGPGHSKAIPLRPEFVVPQDGHDKQDCELAASKRWLMANADRYRDRETTYLGDDLYSHQPFCRNVLLHSAHFIFTCLPESHKTLYDWVRLLENGKELHTVSSRILNKDKHWETHTVRYAGDVPLADGGNALRVSWLELAVHNASGKQTYFNAWITDWAVTNENAIEISASGRARWAIENGNNNTLKTKGYHLEHNFGHGETHLSSVLTALNILAFLLHSYLDLADEKYAAVRAALPSRKTFFEHLQALTTYLYFPSWTELLDFMMKGLEIGPYAQPEGAGKPRRKRKTRKPATGELCPESTTP